MYNISLIVVAILLPLIPSFVLYRFLPSRSVVTGPFRGLTVKITGAASIYFLLVLITSGFVWNLMEKDFEIWDVNGIVLLSDDNTNSNLTPDYFKVSYRPSSTVLNEDGSFKLKILVPKYDGRPELPTLVLEYTGYRPINVPLDDGNVQRPGKKYEKAISGRQIAITTPIELPRSVPNVRR